MATHRKSILNSHANPDASGNVFWEPTNIKFSNDVWRHLVLIFNDSATRDLLYGAFEVPKNYVGSPAIVVVWTTTATTGDVVFDFDYRAVGGNDLESLDQAGTQEAVTVTDTAPSAALERMEASMSLTAANLAIDDTVEFLFARDGAAAGDTMAAAVIVQDILFQWADA